MKTVDIRLKTEEKELLASLIGRTMDSFICDEVDVAPYALEMVAFYVEGQPYMIENLWEVVDHFSEMEDVAVVSAKKVQPEEIYPRTEDLALVTTPIEQKITDIKIYEDRQYMTEDGIDLYENIFTKAILFELEHTQIKVMQTIWFSEFMEVERGAHAGERIVSADHEYADDPEIDENGRTWRAERTIVSLKEEFSDLIYRSS